MPTPKVVHNAFTAKEVEAITGLSVHMTNYLRRMDFLTPAYDQGPGRRGRVRYFSYRDLVIAKLIQRLRLAGVELSTIKEALTKLRSDDLWQDGKQRLSRNLSWLKTDGKDVFIERADGFLEHMRTGQAAFGFLVDIGKLAAQVRKDIPDAIKRSHFSLQNRELIFPKLGARR